MKNTITLLLPALLLVSCTFQAPNQIESGSIAGISGSDFRTFTPTSEIYPDAGRKFTIDLVGAELTAGPEWGEITGVDVVLEYVSLSDNIRFGDDNGNLYANDPGRITFRFTMQLEAGDVNRPQVVARRGEAGFDRCAYLIPGTGPGLYDIVMTARHGDEVERLTYYSFQINQ